MVSRRHKRVVLVPQGSSRNNPKLCYGISLKVWVKNGPFYWVPRLYEEMQKRAPSNKFVFGWLNCTVVFYWPDKLLKRYQQAGKEPNQ